MKRFWIGSATVYAGFMVFSAFGAAYVPASVQSTLRPYVWLLGPPALLIYGTELLWLFVPGTLRSSVGCCSVSLRVTHLAFASPVLLPCSSPGHSSASSSTSRPFDQLAIHAERRDGDATSGNDMAVVVSYGCRDAAHLHMIFADGDNVAVAHRLLENLAYFLRVGFGVRSLGNEGTG